MAEINTQNDAPEIAVVGLNHNTAPLELREAMALNGASLQAALHAICASCRLEECAILSTCNRAEFYFVGNPGSTDAVLGFLGSYRQVDANELAAHSYRYRGQAVVRHLCRVAAGLDSMILGEQQVLGQVKEAATAAAEAHTTGSILSALFRQAVTAGKRARAETKISQGAVSISHAAVELARQIFGELSGCKALVLGAGEMGEITLKLLRNAGMKTSIMVSNRTRERAEALAQSYGGVGVEWEAFPTSLAQADIVIVSTSAPHYIVRDETVRQAMKTRRSRHIFLIDISVPRNVEPSVGDLPDVFLYNIDDLQEVVEKNLGDRSQEAIQVGQIIEEEIERFQAWYNSLAVVPAITGLREHAERLRAEEWHRFSAKLEHLSDADRSAMEAFSRQLMERVLREPILNLKALGMNGRGYNRVEAVQELFGLQATGTGDGTNLSEGEEVSRVPSLDSGEANELAKVEPDLLVGHGVAGGSSRE